MPMPVHDLFNWYVAAGDVLCGDACVARGQRYDGFVRDMLRGAPYSQIRRSDGPGDGCQLVFVQLRLSSASRDEDDDVWYATCAGSDDAYRLVSMDGFFLGSAERRQRQVRALLKRCRNRGD